MPLVESAATRILTRHAYVNAVLDKAGEGQAFGHAVINGALATAHFCPLLQQLLHFRMDVKTVRVGGEPSAERRDFFR